MAKLGPETISNCKGTQASKHCRLVPWPRGELPRERHRNVTVTPPIFPVCFFLRTCTRLWQIRVIRGCKWICHHTNTMRRSRKNCRVDSLNPVVSTFSLEKNCDNGVKWSWESRVAWRRPQENDGAATMWNPGLVVVSLSGTRANFADLQTIRLRLQITRLSRLSFAMYDP